MLERELARNRFIFVVVVVVFFKIKSVVLKGESSVDFEVLEDLLYSKNLHLPLSEGQGGRWSFPRLDYIWEATLPSMYVLKHPKKASGLD